MKFMRPLAVEKRQNDNTAAAAAAPRVSRSVGHSVNQSTSHHHPSLETIFINKIHNHQSFEPIMHPGGWCTYRCRVPGERARSHRQRRAGRIYRSTILHERIKQQEQHKPNESPQRQNPTQPTSTRASSSKWQCQRKGGAPNHSHINLPPDSRKVSNRIDGATRAKHRSEEGGARCATKVNAD